MPPSPLISWWYFMITVLIIIVIGHFPSFCRVVGFGGVQLSKLHVVFFFMGNEQSPPGRCYLSKQCLLLDGGCFQVLYLSSNSYPSILKSNISQQNKGVHLDSNWECFVGCSFFAEGQLKHFTEYQTFHLLQFSIYWKLETNVVFWKVQFSLIIISPLFCRRAGEGRLCRFVCSCWVYCPAVQRGNLQSACIFQQMKTSRIKLWWTWLLCAV